mmetsp:Transcript_39750/g.74512  ORF Transcript_39750/g.74512 Transcript_39750/m.74512 type:complete len:117 (-) Transcript_39750:487-837(-)
MKIEKSTHCCAAVAHLANAGAARYRQKRQQPVHYQGVVLKDLWPTWLQIEVTTKSEQHGVKLSSSEELLLLMGLNCAIRSRIGDASQTKSLLYLIIFQERSFGLINSALGDDASTR